MYVQGWSEHANMPIFTCEHVGSRGSGFNNHNVARPPFSHTHGSQHPNCESLRLEKKKSQPTSA
jgi:hypothetical protein